MTERFLTWAQTAALNPNAPQCSECGIDLALFRSVAYLRRCDDCRQRAALVAALPLRAAHVARRPPAGLRAAA